MSPTHTPDLEAQATKKNRVPLLSAKMNSGYEVLTKQKLAYLGVYFLLNVLLTIYNKAVLGKVLKFTLPQANIKIA
jgi:hypothetical protein